MSKSSAAFRSEAGGDGMAARRLCQLPTGTKTRIGYDYVHTAIDDHTRLAYSEVLPDEKDLTCAGFLHRALAWFAAHGVRVQRLLTDNAMVYGAV